MKKAKKYGILVLAVLVVGFLYYYVTLPAINIHSSGFWFALVLLILAVMASQAVPHLQNPQELRQNKRIKLLGGMAVAVVAVYVVGSILSSPIVNAKKYQQLMQVENREFTEDIKQVSYDQIPILDKEMAVLLGNREMGSMVDMVSQFEVSERYTQINYKDKPVRVSPLVYATPIKWLTNQSEGIPAYVLIDMTSQDTQLVKLDEGIRYSESEYFNRNIYRHLRFRYPTYIFDDLSFEINEEGVPYWIAPVKKFNIGLFGGQTIGKVVLCNAITGETVEYDIDEVPTWIDSVYNADLLMELYNYHGTLQHGFLNSILGQRDCLRTTEGYNYLALEDDVWVYTGITSVNTDQSSVGFVLMNQRTMESRYYSVEGAIEESAMRSAEGQVQHLGYTASFPLLLNIANEPTYFIALKDNAGLVKTYAMVNIQKYQWVAIGDTVQECEQAYISLLNTNGISESNPADTLEKSGIIEAVAPVVVDGNTHYYIVLEGDEAIYDILVSEFPQAVRLTAGDSVQLTYIEGGAVNSVEAFERGVPGY